MISTAAIPASDPMETTPAWSYEEAFCRNLGILDRQEQEKLRQSRVAIIGMGGVGGLHLMTLARLGIGAFTIADPDRFELANFNRQYGARTDTIGRPKVEVMAEQARAVNPELDLRVMQEPVSEANVADFLDGADILVDGVDFFAIEARRLVFREARRRQIWGITAGPHAFSAAWLLFNPVGMSFDQYFDFRDGMSEAEQLAAFAVGSVPAGLHLKYLDLNKFFQPGRRAGASIGLACHLAAGVASAEVLKVLLRRSDIRPAPCFFQFDAHRGRLRQGRLRWGNRGPWQQLKRRWLIRKFRSAN